MHDGAGATRPDDKEKRAGDEKGAEPACQDCGEPQTRNPHPRAGDPSLEFGYRWHCIPCLVKSRAAWTSRCYAAERECERLAAAPPRGLDSAREALAELVACEDLRIRAGKISPVEPGCEKEVLMDEYRRRDRFAWEAARAALTGGKANGR
jgi:hypothetical protein